MFKVGQKVVCINKEGWESGVPQIKYGEIVTILLIDEDDGFLEFIEYPGDGIDEDQFDPNEFRPTQDNFVEEVLEKAKEEYRIEKQELILQVLN